jgi:AraC-like DNA-binding protein
MSGSPLATQLTPWMLAIAEELREKSPGYLVMAKSALIQLCSRLLRHYNGLLTEDERHHMVHSVRQAQSLAALVEHRYHEPVSLGELAGTDKTVADIAFECGFQSLPTFYRVFKETVGLSPIRYRQSIGVTE